MIYFEIFSFLKTSLKILLENYNYFIIKKVKTFF